jgi:hypothetical protein
MSTLSSASALTNRHLSEARRAQAADALVVLGFLFLNPIWVFGISSLLGRYRSKTWINVLAALSLTVFVCNRRFGGDEDDVPMYAYLFQAATEHSLHYLLQNWTFEPGFVIVTKCLALLTGDKKVYVFLIFLLINYLFVHAANRLSRVNPFFPLLCYFVTFGAVFFDHVRALRQTLSLALLLCGIVELHRDEGKSMRPYLFLMAAPVIHVSSLAVSAAFIATKLVWNRSRLLKLAGALLAFVLAYIVANVVLALFYGVSSRIQVYATAPVVNVISAAQLGIGFLLASWLLYKGVFRTTNDPRAPMWYSSGLLALCLLIVYLSGKLPEQVIARELIYVLGMLTIVSAATLQSDRTFSRFVIPLVLLEMLRFSLISLDPPDTMLIVNAYGATNPWNGLIVNSINYASATVTVPAYYASGGL